MQELAEKRPALFLISESMQVCGRLSSILAFRIYRHPIGSCLPI